PTSIWRIWGSTCRSIATRTGPCTSSTPGSTPRSRRAARSRLSATDMAGRDSVNAGWGGHRPVGSHSPTSGGLARAALPYADAAGSEAVQVYVGNSRGWALPAGDPAQDVAFRDGCEQRGLVAYIHASLLVNLGSPTEA